MFGQPARKQLVQDIRDQILKQPQLTGGWQDGGIHVKFLDPAKMADAMRAMLANKSK